MLLSPAERFSILFIIEKEEGLNGCFYFLIIDLHLSIHQQKTLRLHTDKAYHSCSLRALDNASPHLATNGFRRTVFQIDNLVQLQVSFLHQEWKRNGIPSIYNPVEERQIKMYMLHPDNEPKPR